MVKKVAWQLGTRCGLPSTQMNGGTSTRIGTETITMAGDSLPILVLVYKGGEKRIG